LAEVFTVGGLTLTPGVFSRWSSKFSKKKYEKDTDLKGLSAANEL
jgi:hypothetical protein